VLNENLRYDTTRYIYMRPTTDCQPVYSSTQNQKSNGKTIIKNVLLRRNGNGKIPCNQSWSQAPQLKILWYRYTAVFSWRLSWMLKLRMIPESARTYVDYSTMMHVKNLKCCWFVSLIIIYVGKKSCRGASGDRRQLYSLYIGWNDVTTQLNSTENYGRRCLTPLSPHRNYILS